MVVMFLLPFSSFNDQKYEDGKIIIANKHLKWMVLNHPIKSCHENFVLS